MRAHHLRRTAGLTLALGALAVALGVLGPPVRPGHAQGKDGKDELQGKWVGLLVSFGGQVLPQPEKFSVNIQDKRITLAMGETSLAGPLRVDTTQNPKHFEMDVFPLAPTVRQQWGIYKVEGDLLTISIAMRFEGLPRPMTFEDRLGMMMVLKREGAKLTPAQEKELREFVALGAVKRHSINNLRQIAVAMHLFHDTYKRFPPPVLMSKDGKPLLSWRVAILPFLEEGALYNQFKLNEPWDSPNNIKLLEKMPKAYAPVRGKTKEPHTTYYQMFVGPDAWPVQHLPGKEGLFSGMSLRMPGSFKNGTSNTIMVVEAGEPVPWSKPADLPFDAKKPLPKLGGLFKDGFHVVMGDAATLFVPRILDERILRLVINRNSRVPVPSDWNVPERK
jgi:uncharacterized protein (TIGR03067 family)